MPIRSGYLLLTVDAGAFYAVLILLVVVVVPVAAVAFARSGKGLEELGRGRFAVDFDQAGEEDREEELRQLVEARAWRRENRGEDPGDVNAEITRVLALDPGLDPDPAEPIGRTDSQPDGLRAEVRQVVIARNESRQRRGEPLLEVEAETNRLLGELS